MNTPKQYRFVGGPSRRRRQNRPRKQASLARDGQSTFAVESRTKQPNPAPQRRPDTPPTKLAAWGQDETVLQEEHRELPPILPPQQFESSHQVPVLSPYRLAAVDPARPTAPSYRSLNAAALDLCRTGTASTGVPSPEDENQQVSWLLPDSSGLGHGDWAPIDRDSSPRVSYELSRVLEGRGDTSHPELPTTGRYKPRFLHPTGDLQAKTLNAPTPLHSRVDHVVELDAAANELAWSQQDLAILPHSGGGFSQDFCFDHRLFVQPSALYDTISRIFIRYDQEFCILPITHDCSSNPFRYDYQKVQNYSLLRHSVLALSYRHVNFDTGNGGREAVAHRRRAIQMLKQKMVANPGPDVSLLDSSVVLFTLDYAISAFGPWSSHFKRVGLIIRNTPYASLPLQRRAQVALFAWFDVTLGLTGRHGTFLPQSLAESIISDDRDAGGERGCDKLDFFSVSGCPLDLFQFMVQVAQYAWEMRIISKMPCAKFDLTPVMRLQQAISLWACPIYADPEPTGLDQYLAENQTADPREAEELLQKRLDWYHCAESMRHVLLLYIERVFIWQTKVRRKKSADELGQPSDTKTTHAEEDNSSLMKLRFLARRTLNHVKCIRSTTFVQKQLILPVFLAAAEVKEDGLRHDALHFCSWWRERIRYNLYVTTQALLGEIWQQPSDDAWWGDVLDQKSRHSGKEYLFG